MSLLPSMAVTDLRLCPGGDRVFCFSSCDLRLLFLRKKDPGSRQSCAPLPQHLLLSPCLPGRRGGPAKGLPSEHRHLCAWRTPAVPRCPLATLGLQHFGDIQVISPPPCLETIFLPCSPKAKPFMCPSFLGSVCLWNSDMVALQTQRDEQL